MVIIDYISFTFCPDDLEPIRRLAAAGKQSFAQFLKNRDASQPAIDIDFLDQSCRENVTTFCQMITKDFFAGQEWTTYDTWSEVFTMYERGRGMFGYRSSWDLYLNGTHIGIAASGAKNGGCYISFSGEGTALIDPEKLLSQIKYLPLIKITRVDLAYDDHEGRYSCDYAFEQWMLGAFKMRKGGVNPNHDWFKSGGKLVKNEYGIERDIEYTGGRTFQVGSRKSGKLCRIYEKGKQQGDPSSRWTRWEVEIHSKDREIPLFILTDPASYFLGSYPAFEVFREEIQKHKDVEPRLIKTERKTKVKIGYERMESSARESYGPLINVMRQSKGMTDSQIVEALISRNEFAVPRRLEKAVGASLPITDSGPWSAPDVNNQGASSWQS